MGSPLYSIVALTQNRRLLKVFPPIKLAEVYVIYIASALGAVLRLARAMTASMQTVGTYQYQLPFNE